MLNVCLGILARNEAKRIGNLIADLNQQTLLTGRDVCTGLYIIANGCTDDTAQVAEKALSDNAVSERWGVISIHNLRVAGKSNAWNEFIHSIAPPDTDYIFLADADIRIPEREALQRALHRLASSEATVAIGESVSDLSLRKPNSFAEWLIKAGTGTKNDPYTALSGAFYCARYPELAKIWMPIGLPVENGFLRAMIMTKGFLETETPSRLVFVEGARHIFESERSVRAVIRHNLRLWVGTALNVLLFNHLRKLAAERVDLSSYIHERNLRDSTWLNSLVEEKLRSPVFFIVDKGALLARLTRLRNLCFRDRLKAIPMLCIGLVFDVFLLIKANKLMRRGKAAGFW